MPSDADRLQAVKLENAKAFGAVVGCFSVSVQHRKNVLRQGSSPCLECERDAHGDMSRKELAEGEHSAE
eukprot:8011158-Prorocentrum_lima.AAC.1